MVTAITENIMEVPLKVKIELPHEPVVSPLRVYVEKNRIRRDICTQVCTAAPVTIAKT